MQKRGCGIRTAADYRERLSPSLWALVAAAVCGPMAALVFSPLDTTLALFIGLLVSVAIVVGLVAISPVVEIRDGELRAGRGHIPVESWGPPSAWPPKRRARPAGVVSTTGPGTSSGVVSTVSSRFP